VERKKLQILKLAKLRIPAFSVRMHNHRDYCGTFFSTCPAGRDL
jgi:hypothetical protein